MRNLWFGLCRVTTSLARVLDETDNVVLSADIQSASNPLSRSRDGGSANPSATEATGPGRGHWRRRSQ